MKNCKIVQLRIKVNLEILLDFALPRCPRHFQIDETQFATNLNKS